ncbi:MAG: SGNH/GDSL hydrolase family protein [Deltaproteobacteria bacterium]|nr:SGNH/GDSL hydrolase family protein [Deltaproteobacteria bacterium]
MHRRRSFAKNIAFTVAAVFLGLAVLGFGLELGLRALGALRSHRHPTRVTIPIDLREQAIDIVCTGDSHTEGIGAPSGLDYPSQLRALIAEQDRTGPVRVHNIGLAGSNSSQAVDAVATFIRQTGIAPDVVLFNAGKNNPHNFTNVRMLPDEIRGESLSAQAQFLLRNSRAFRFGTVTAARLDRLSRRTTSSFETVHDDVLDVSGDPEQEFIAEWIVRDVVSLRDLVGPTARLFVLNYWEPANPWVDQAFERLQNEAVATFVDVRNFGIPDATRWSVRPYVVYGDWHPNEKGYALIARRVFSALQESGALTDPRTSARSVEPAGEDSTRSIP